MKTVNQNINGTTAILFQSEAIKTGTKLSFQNNREILIGSGVSLVRVSFGAMADSAGGSPYLYCTIRKNNSITSHFIDATTASFKSVSGSMLVSVAPGDTISVSADTGGGPLVLQSNRNQYLEVEALS